MLVLDKTDIRGSPVGTPVTDRIDIRDSPVGIPTIDRIDIRGNLAEISLGLDTIRGHPVGDSQHLDSGLHLEIGADRGLTIDHSLNPLVDQGHPDITPIQGKVGHPTERTDRTGTVPCPPETPTLS
jgi:hypothetical protein